MEEPQYQGAVLAARLLGLTPRSVYRLMEEGELGHVQVYELMASGRMRRRRSLLLTRKDVYDLIEQAWVQPGTLGHLCGPPTSPPELELRIIDRFVRRLAGKDRLTPNRPAVSAGSTT